MWGLMFSRSYIDCCSKSTSQFYSLSKVHHPDHNPNDPEASTRFVEISEAYAILGSPQKRERYDRENRRASDGPQIHERQGSHSSSAPFGSRPASGLSRRRAQFRGPPPSFYRSGGWGNLGAKRRSQAESTASRAADTAAGSIKAGSRMGPGGGFGPGGAQAGRDNDVPHFDRDAHHKMQEQQDERRRRRLEDEAFYSGSSGGVWINFVMLSGVVALAGSLPLMFGKGPGKDKEDL